VTDPTPTSNPRPRPTSGLRQLLIACALAWGPGATVPATAGTIVAVPPPPGRADVEVFFSPGGDTDRAIAGQIAAARQRVWLAGYYFTSATIARALAQAHARGVDVRVVLDSSQATQQYSSATYFHDHGVALWINARYPVMHHKFLIVDADTLGLGSMNFTRAGAQKNAENFNLFRRWPALVAPYAAEFERLAAESVRYRPGLRFDADGDAAVPAKSERPE